MPSKMDPLSEKPTAKIDRPRRQSRSPLHFKDFYLGPELKELAKNEKVQSQKQSQKKPSNIDDAEVAAAAISPPPPREREPPSSSSNELLSPVLAKNKILPHFSDYVLKSPTVRHKKSTSKLYTDKEGKVYSEDELKQLVKQFWRESGQASAFGGITTMKNEIFQDKGLSIPPRVIEEALHEDATYVTHVQERQVVPMRHYNASFFGELLQLDSGTLKLLKTYFVQAFLL